MRLKYIFLTIITIVVLQACGGSSNAPRAADTSPATNPPDGDPVTAVITARFAPADGILPFPINLVFRGTTDLTLNPPTDDATNYSDPAVALSALDGFSTIAPWGAPFSANVAASSVVPGQSVRVFEVKLTGPGGAVTEILGELQAGVDFVAVANGAGIGIVPLKALKQISNYMAILTNGITDEAGNIATPDQTYFIAKRTSPLVDDNGNSTDPLIPDANAQALEPLRQLINSQEIAATSQGINRDDIVLSFVMTTQSITPVLNAVKAISGAGASTLAPTGSNTSTFGGAGIADIWIGIQSSPYYLTAPSAENPIAPLNSFWQAAPGAYMAPFDALGLDPTSTNLTFANPFPVATGMQTYPVIMTLPNADSGHTKPASGWPIVIFQHGITGNRTNMLAIADTLASIGYAVIAQDLVMHGITDTANPFHIGGVPPFSAIANERTFDVDYIDNATGAPGADGVADTSGSHFINLANLLVTRDNVRQSVADLFTLAATIPTMDYDADGTTDFDGSRIAFVGQSLGAITGTIFMEIEDTVTTGVLSAGGGGIARLLDGSPTFGPRIRAGLAAAGLEPGTPEYARYMVVAQTVIDAGDPLNFAASTGALNNILFHEVLGDQVITNTVPGAPLSGTEPLMAAMGLTSISATTSNPEGLDVAVRFTAGGHSSLLNPEASVPVTVEMQTQMASMISTLGTTVVVTDESVVQ